MEARDAGITLIELVVSMAIFAVIAVLGIQALNGTLRAQGQLSASATKTEELSEALALLRADLAGILPMKFETPGGGSNSSFSWGPAEQEISVSVGGQRHISEPERAAFHRVNWKVDQATQTLSRSFWPTTAPASATQQVEPVAILEGVQRMEVRVFIPQQGWQDPATLQPGGLSTEVPLAVDVTLIVEGIGPLSVLETLR